MIKPWTHIVLSHNFFCLFCGTIQRSAAFICIVKYSVSSIAQITIQLILIMNYWLWIYNLDIYFASKLLHHHSSFTCFIYGIGLDVRLQTQEKHVVILPNSFIVPHLLTNIAKLKQTTTFMKHKLSELSRRDFLHPLSLTQNI